MNRELKRKLFYLLFIILIFVGILIAIFHGNGVIHQALFHLKNSQGKIEEMRHAILSHGILSPFLFMGLQVTQVIFAPIPGEASGFLGGYLFGVWPSFLYSTIGLTLGSWIAFAIGRLLDDIIRPRLHKTKLYHRFNHLVCGGEFVVPFVLFLLPGFPKDSLSYLLGLSSMPLPVFLFISAVGRMPGTLLLSLQGAKVYQGNYIQLALLLLLSAAVGVPCIMFRHKILVWLSRYNHRTQKKEHNSTDRETPDA